MTMTTDHLNNQLPKASTLNSSPNQSAHAFVNIQGERSAFKPSTTVRKISKDLTSAVDCEEKNSPEAAAGSSQDQYDRTLKVAKKNYSDHGSHGLVVKTTILKKMTTSLQDLYNDNNDRSTTTSVIQNKNGPDNSDSNHNDAKNNGYNKPVSSPTPSTKKRVSPSQRSSTSSNNTNKPTGLLHAALQQQSTLNSGSSTNQDAPSRGECLTNPKDPSPNNGLDNIEGNLIVCENDLIQVPNQKAIPHKPSRSCVSRLDGMTTYQVLGLLGQGTFAQVFKCKNIETGELCAVKIVKNKPAYTRQALIEIDIFIALSQETPSTDSIGIQVMDKKDENADEHMVNLLSYFMYKSHLCLVFELLGLNLYELLKRRQFRGLPISVVQQLVKQAIHGTNVLSQKNVVHCDLKPENILVVSDEVAESMINSKNSERNSSERNGLGMPQKPMNKIKLIDFGSACFVGKAAHTYIQSRFYRSPEVLIGLDYDTAIDMWSLGCVAAELFLGLPILPGIHEHDQLGRICEMIGKIPDWMLEHGKKSSKYFVLDKIKPKGEKLNIIQSKELTKETWRLKNREEFITSLSAEEKKRFGGQSKLEQQPTSRYFKKKLLGDIVMLHGNCSSAAEKESLVLFVHFLKGILNPDPCERWTAFQASTHPFLAGITYRRRSTDETLMGKGKLKITNEIYWSKPWDPSECRRILTLKGSKRSGPSNLHKSLESHKEEGQSQPVDNRSSHLVSPTTRVTDMTGAMSISFDHHRGRQTPPPQVHRRASYGTSIPQSYHTPTSGTNLSVGSLPLHMAGANTSRYSQPPSNLSLHEHFDSVDLPIGVPDQLVVPTLPITLGAQSFSGAFHSGMAHGPEGDLGYALQRPGVVPTGPGAPPQLNPMYMHHHHVQPQYQMSGYSTDMGHYLSSSFSGVPTPHFTGPLSPQNHHSQQMNIPQDRYPLDNNYHYGSGQMQPPQQYQMYQYESRDYDEPPPPRRWSNYSSNNYRGSSM